MYPSSHQSVLPLVVSCTSLLVGMCICLVLVVYCTFLENLQLAWGLRRWCRWEVHVAALNMACEGQVSAALLCLFHVNNHFPLWETLKYTQTQKVRSAFHVYMDFYQIILTLLCCLLAKDSFQEWYILMISLLRRQTVQWTVVHLLLTMDKDEFCQNPLYSNRDFTGACSLALLLQSSSCIPIKERKIALMLLLAVKLVPVNTVVGVLMQMGLLAFLCTPLLRAALGTTQLKQHLPKWQQWGSLGKKYGVDDGFVYGSGMIAKPL